MLYDLMKFERVRKVDTDTIPENLKLCIDIAYSEHEVEDKPVSGKIFTFPNTPLILMVRISENTMDISAQDQRNPNFSNLDEKAYGGKVILFTPLELSDLEIAWLEACGKHLH